MKPIGFAVPGAVTELLRSAPTSPGKIAFAWKAAVGPAFGKVTAVHLEGTELLVDPATTHWAREIRRASPIILRRLQELVGKETITSLTIRPAQDAKPSRVRRVRRPRT